MRCYVSQRSAGLQVSKSLLIQNLSPNFMFIYPSKCQFCQTSKSQSSGVGSDPNPRTPASQVLLQLVSYFLRTPSHKVQVLSYPDPPSSLNVQSYIHQVLLQAQRSSLKVQAQERCQSSQRLVKSIWFNPTLMKTQPTQIECRCTESHRKLSWDHLN